MTLYMILEYHTQKNASLLKDKLALYLTLLFSTIRRKGKTYERTRRLNSKANIMPWVFRVV